MIGRFRERSYAFLFREVHPGTLGWIRIAYGVLMVWQFQKFGPYLEYLVGESEFFMTYDYFHWVTPLSVETGWALVTIGTVAGVLLIVGALYRLSALTIVFCWGYMFFICRGHYTNHYYLFLLLGVLMTFTNGHRWRSVDNLIYDRFPALRRLFWKDGIRPKTIPHWQIFIFQFQVVVVYFFGGVAKMNPDWVQGYPMRYWLADRGQWPVVGPILNNEVAVYFFSWGGLVFDTIVGFVLWSRYRVWALPVIGFFHISNHFIWLTIGGFPWFMLAATGAFFPHEWPEKFLNWLRNFGSRKRKPIATWDVPVRPLGWQRKVTIVLLAGFMSWQSLYPLRHFLYPGDPMISGEGALFAWRMMLVQREYGAKVRIAVDGNTVGYITGDSFLEYVNMRQLRRMFRMPKQFHRFAHFLRDEMQKTNPDIDPEIYAYLMIEYNGRPFQHVIDTTVNLAAEPYPLVKHAPWLLEEQEGLVAGTIQY